MCRDSNPNREHVMDATSRQTLILEQLTEHSGVQVDALSAQFGVTRQTIRADLRDLDERGLLERTHGGAVPADQRASREYADRRKRNAAEKEAMGRLAATLIPDGCSVMLNIGTSTEQVARALANHRDLTVLSNNINIINTLMGTRSKDLILIGGAVRQSDGAIVGEDAVEYISRYKVDFAVVGASALDADGAVLDFDAREVSVARAILRNARRKILVCDHTKFAVNAPVRICAISEIDHFVTDLTPPDSFSAQAHAAGTETLTVKGPHD